MVCLLQIHCEPMRVTRFFLLAAWCWTAVGAHAQWQWIDKDGRKVYSDRPPPAEVSEQNILKQPHRRTAAQPPAQASSTPASAPAAAPAKAPAPTGKDKALEKKKAEAEAQEAAKAQAEEEQRAATRADICLRAGNMRTTYASGQRLTQTNAQGERVPVDDAMRAAELQRLDGIIAKNCQ